MSTLSRLTGAAYGVHFADQVALVSVPILAVLVFDASPEVIGLLVACQSMAHLLGSIPFGVLVDNRSQNHLVTSATVISMLGFVGAALAVLWGSLFWFGICVTFAGFGVVLFSLSVLSILPKAVAQSDLAAANASVELPRAMMSFAVPLCVGLVVSAASAVWIIAFAAVAAGAALFFARGLPIFPATGGAGQRNPLMRIYEGGKYVLHHKLLRAISICAIFWNFAFAALLVIMVPFIRNVLLLDAGVFGIALAAFGVGALAGTSASKRFARSLSPRFVLLFGPGSSFLAASLLGFVSSGSSAWFVYSLFLLLGFGPSMWLVAQNSVRQLVSPPGMLGRVNAVIQTTIYGVRPVAALFAGALVGATSPQIGLVFVAIGFGLSFLAAALSGLRQIVRYEDLGIAPAVA